jgi:hypothetical protein
MSASYGKAASRVAITFGDMNPVLIKSIKGGVAKVNKAAFGSATSNFGIFTPTQVTFDEIKIEVALGHGQQLLDQFNLFIDNAHEYIDGRVDMADAKLDVYGGYDFSQALITELSLPKLDAAGKDMYTISASLKPTMVTPHKGGGKIAGTTNVKTKNVINSNFKLEVGGLPCGRCKSIDAFTWKNKCQENRFGEARYAELVPTVMEQAVLKATFDGHPDTYGPWADWFKTFALDGANGSEAELAGAVTWLDSKSQGEVFRLEMQNIGIHELAGADTDGNGDKVREFTVTCYVENFDLRALNT